MAVVFGGSGPQADPDDDKARKTDSLCHEWRIRLSDPKFAASLPRGAQERIRAAVSKVSFNLAIYRGELLKGQRRQMSGSPGALATTTTLRGGAGGNPGAAAVQALAILAAAAITVLVVAATRAAFNAGQTLENSLKTLQTASEETAVIMTPIPLNFSPNLSPSLLTELISRGVIVVAGGLMTISISKLRDFIETLRDEAKEAKAHKICLEELAALESIIESLTQTADQFEQMLIDGTTQSGKDAMVKIIMDLLAKAGKALAALGTCLEGGTFNPSPTKPPTSGLN